MNWRFAFGYSLIVLLVLLATGFWPFRQPTPDSPGIAPDPAIDRMEADGRTDADAAGSRDAIVKNDVAASDDEWLRQQVASLFPGMADEVAGYEANLERLQNYISEHPKFWIPEMALLEDEDFAPVVVRELNDDDAIRAALGDLRAWATQRALPLITRALDAYAEDFDGNVPYSAVLLERYLSDKRLAPALADYKVVRTGLLYDKPTPEGSVARTSPTEVIVIDRMIDFENDKVTVIRGGGGAIFDAEYYWRNYATGKFREAHPGAEVKETTDILPYLPSEVVPYFMNAEEE